MRSLCIRVVSDGTGLVDEVNLYILRVRAVDLKLSHFYRPSDVNAAVK